MPCSSEPRRLLSLSAPEDGIDEETIAMFEQNLSKNLYMLWNRMSSGSYFPPPVKDVESPKAKGGTRKLGIPTVADRIAQTVVKQLIEPTLAPMFHPDSYGYRPGRSAKQAIAVTRKRRRQYDWVVEFDIKAAFDQVDQVLLMKAVRSHIKEGWILLYIERWLKAPFETAEGTQAPREREGRDAGDRGTDARASRLGDYFRAGNADREFNKVDYSVVTRLRRWQFRRGGQRSTKREPLTGGQLYGMGLHKLMGTVKYPAQATPRRSSVSRVPENGMHGGSMETGHGNGPTRRSRYRAIIYQCVLKRLSCCSAPRPR